MHLCTDVCVIHLDFSALIHDFFPRGFKSPQDLQETRDLRDAKAHPLHVSVPSGGCHTAGYPGGFRSAAAEPVRESQRALADAVDCVPRLRWGME